MVVSKIEDNLATVGSGYNFTSDILGSVWGVGSQGFSEPQFAMHKMGVRTQSLVINQTWF